MERAAVMTLTMAAVAAALSAHIFYCRYLSRGSRRSPQNVLGMIIVGGDALLLALLLPVLGTLPATVELAGVGYGLVVYNAVMYAYFHLFNMSETARRIRMLLLIRERGALGDAELAEIYSPREMVAVRLERLQRMGWLVSAGAERYRIGAAWALLLARLFATLRRVLGFGR